MATRYASAQRARHIRRQTLKEPAAILDVDGTLLDSNYHHALAWQRAFRVHDLVLPAWRLHRHVGMGGDKYVAAVSDDATEERLGDVLRQEWEAQFDQLLDEIEPLAGASELIVKLKRRGHQVVLASSAIAAHLDAFLDKLDARELLDGWTSKDEVKRSKPDSDLVEAALHQLGTRNALLVGDTPWDVAAAARAGIATIGVLTGGFSESELHDSGAIAVYEGPNDLLRRLEQSPFAGIGG